MTFPKVPHKNTTIQKKSNIPWKQFDRKFLPPAKKKIAWVILTKVQTDFEKNAPRSGGEFFINKQRLINLQRIKSKGSIMQESPSWKRVAGPPTGCSVGS